MLLLYVEVHIYGVIIMKNVVLDHYLLDGQFDRELNVGIRSGDLSIHDSRRMVWWKCDRGHSWNSTPYARIDRKNGGRLRPCPYCSGRKASSDNNISITHEDICKEWNHSKNNFGPESVTHKMVVKVWWICKYGHEWKAQVYSRADQGTGCPKCNRRQTSHIELRMYAELKSIFKDAERDVRIVGWRVDVLLPSYRVVVEIDGSHWHEKKTEIDKRKDAVLSNAGYTVIRVRESGLSPTGCNTVWYKDGESHLIICERAIRFIIDRFCPGIIYNGWNNEELFMKMLSEIGGFGRKVLEKIPMLEHEWHPTRNGRLRCEDVTIGSGVNVWWICSLGHEYQMPVKARSRGRGCPYCSGKRVLIENSVAYHTVASEWAKDLNLESPEKFLLSSNKKVWWRCVNGHVWNAKISSRTHGNGCPYCSRRGKSMETIEYNKNKDRPNYNVKEDWAVTTTQD